jgi:hypothetical protein
VTELDRAIEAAQRLLDRILFIAFAEDRGLLPDRNLLNRTAFVRVAGLTAWQAFQLLFRSIDKGDPLNGIPKYNGNLFKPDPILDDLGFALDGAKWPQVFVMMGDFDYRNEVTVDVLGRIFERSITDIEEIKAKSLDQHAATLGSGRGHPLSGTREPWVAPSPPNFRHGPGETWKASPSSIEYSHCPSHRKAL